MSVILLFLLWLRHAQAPERCTVNCRAQGCLYVIPEILYGHTAHSCTLLTACDCVMEVRDSRQYPLPTREIHKCLALTGSIALPMFYLILQVNTAVRKKSFQLLSAALRKEHRLDLVFVGILKEPFTIWVNLPAHLTCFWKLLKYVILEP